MTIINIYVKDSEKKKIKQFIKDKIDAKSMSEFMRNLIKEKMMIESESESSKSEEIEIPDYIPKNKYVLFANNSIVAVGDSPNEVTLEAAEKDIKPPFTIKYNGKTPGPIDYVYQSLDTGNAWKYINFDEMSYPVIEMFFKSGNAEKKIFASIDTAASLCVLKEGLFQEAELKSSKEKRNISTAAGIIEKTVFQSKIQILDKEFEAKYIIAPINDQLPFQFLVGRNLLDKLDAFFFGKKQIILLRNAE